MGGGGRGGRRDKGGAFGDLKAVKFVNLLKCPSAGIVCRAFDYIVPVVGCPWRKGFPKTADLTVSAVTVVLGQLVS